MPLTAPSNWPVERPQAESPSVRPDDPHALLPALQAKWPGWVITWGAWRRTYTAFECRDPMHCRIIEAATPEVLQNAMADVEADLRHALPDTSLRHRR
jgi:hypothetical protein